MRKTQKEPSQAKFLVKAFLMLFFCFLSITAIQAQNIEGTVVDEFQEPLVGVSVALKGTSKGTMTDLNGKYSIIVEGSESVLVFSLVGHEKQETKVGAQTSINVVIKEDSELLEEVIVIGFQSQKKVNLTAAVENVGTEVFENRPVSNIGQALQGVVPNLNINIDGGNPNKVPKINIRGATTMRRRAETGDDKNKYDVVAGSPLILIDGIEVSEEDLNQINPNDIANMSVLKDASAAAIYGTRGTFGVILVQTKGGSYNQKAKINYSYDVTWDKPFELPDILNSYTHFKSTMDKRKWTKEGVYTPEDEEKLAYMKAYMENPNDNLPYFMRGNTIQWVGNTDPYKEILRSWTPTQKHNMSVTGGSEKVNYYVSLGMQDQEGMFNIGEDRLRRYNVMTNLNAKVTNWFNIGTKVSYNIFNYREPNHRKPGNLWTVLLTQYPDQTLYMPANTGPLGGPNGIHPNTPTQSVLGYVQGGGIRKTSRKTAMYSISPEFIIIPKELKVRADLSLTPITFNREVTSPQQLRVFESWINLANVDTPYNEGEVTKSNTNKYTINTYIDYNKMFAAKHNFSALLGLNQERETYSVTTINLKRMIDPHILNPTLVEDATLNTTSVGHYEYTSRAAFGRLMYDYEGKYLVEFDARYDGSSKFPKDNRFQFFPTFSLGWRISDESFFASTRSWLDNLKIRYSWGRLGSQPDYKYQSFSTYSSDPAKYLFNGRYPTAIYPPSLVNPELTWEKATSQDLGVDITVLRNRLNATFDVFQRKTTDILIPGGGEYPTLLGETPPDENIGVLTSKGWELTLKWKDQLSNGFRYDLGVALSDNTATVDEFPGNAISSIVDGKLYKSQKHGDIWGYVTGGILQAEDFTTDANGKLVHKGATFRNEEIYPGYIWYKDLNGDGIISAGDDRLGNSGDRIVIGNNSPRYRYSITSNFAYKGIDLNLFFQGVGKRDFWLPNGSNYWGNGAGSWETHNNSWKPDQTDAKFPMYGSVIGTRPQSGYLIDGSYFALRQTVLGYTLPKSISRKAKMEKLRVNISAYNLFTITDVPKWMDPEVASSNYPMKKSISLGVQVEF